MLKMFMNLAAAGALFALVGPVSAQEIREVDPNAPTSWTEPATPRAGTPAAAPQAAAPPGDAEDWTPVEGQAASAAPPTNDIRNVPVTGHAGTVPRHDVFNAAEGVFGRGARGLA